MGSGRNLAQGEYNVYQPGQLEDLQERRQNMSQIESSTPGVPHMTDSQSFRQTATAAADKQVFWLCALCVPCSLCPACGLALELPQQLCKLHQRLCLLP